MHFENPEVTLWGICPTDRDNAICRIERAARVCYNSEARIAPGSANNFVERLLKPTPPHMSVTEHSNLVMRSEKVTNPQKQLELFKSKLESHFIFGCIRHGRVYIYGNYRAFFEALPIDDFFTMPDCVPLHFPGYALVTDPADIPLEAQSVTIAFKTDRAVTHEIVRHRHKTAYLQRSQRYCDESDLAIIAPYWWGEASPEVKKQFTLACYQTEDMYKFLKDQGYSNQAARAVLPNCTSTRIIITAYMSAWHWFNYLRTSDAAYPGIRGVMKEAVRQLREAGLEI